MPKDLFPVNIYHYAMICQLMKAKMSEVRLSDLPQNVVLKRLDTITLQDLTKVYEHIPDNCVLEKIEIDEKMIKVIYYEPSQSKTRKYSTHKFVPNTFILRKPFNEQPIKPDHLLRLIGLQYDVFGLLKEK